jgi:hypothetical protein
LYRYSVRRAVRAPLPFLACELCREHIGKNPCDRRRKTSEYQAMFPGVDFSCVAEEEDVLWRGCVQVESS